MAQPGHDAQFVGVLGGKGGFGVDLADLPSSATATPLFVIRLDRRRRTWNRSSSQARSCQPLEKDSVSPSRLRSSALGTAGVVFALVAFQVAKYNRGTRERFVMGEGPDTGTAEFSRLVSAMTGAPVRHGNRVEIMRNGPTLDAMVEAIASAKATIDCSSYIYWPGGTADRFSEARGS